MASSRKVSGWWWQRTSGTGAGMTLSWIWQGNDGQEFLNQRESGVNRINKYSEELKAESVFQTAGVVWMMSSR